MGTSHKHMFSGLVPSLNANGRALHRGQAYQAVVGEDDDLLSFESANNLRDSGAPTIESSQNTPAPSDNDLMDLLGGPGPTSDGLETVSAAGSSDPAQAPQSLVRTSSAEAFEQFFGARSNVDDVFASPVTPGTPIKAV